MMIDKKVYGQMIWPKTSDYHNMMGQNLSEDCSENVSNMSLVRVKI